MLSRTRLRILAVIPTLFSIVGIAIIGAAFAFRQFLPAPPRTIAGAVVILACMGAIATLWRAHRYATTAFVFSGTCAFAACLAVARLFPLVNASDEPPPPLAEYYYAGTLVAIGVLTLAGAWIATRLSACALTTNVEADGDLRIARFARRAVRQALASTSILDYANTEPSSQQCHRAP